MNNFPVNLIKTRHCTRRCFIKCAVFRLKTIFYGIITRRIVLRFFAYVAFTVILDPTVIRITLAHYVLYILFCNQQLITIAVISTIFILNRKVNPIISRLRKWGRLFHVVCTLFKAVHNCAVFGANQTWKRQYYCAFFVRSASKSNCANMSTRFDQSLL